ncbi:MAG: hypothetical protein ACK6A7_16715, partial [Planctomycetota bacterium]
HIRSHFLLVVFGLFVCLLVASEFCFDTNLVKVVHVLPLCNGLIVKGRHSVGTDCTIGGEIFLGHVFLFLERVVVNNQFHLPPRR